MESTEEVFAHCKSWHCTFISEGAYSDRSLLSGALNTTILNPPKPYVTYSLHDSKFGCQCQCGVQVLCAVELTDN